MQKKIIALAIAAAFSAPAFADTTVYGLVDVAVARASGDGQKSDTQVVSGGLAGSRIGVNSSEDLGNGMKVLVNLEYGLDVARDQTIGGASPAARQQMLGLAGGFGTVATGFLQTTGYDFGKSFDPTAGSTVSPLDNITAGAGFQIGTNAGLKRAPRALAYISPDMGGLTLAINYSTDASGGLGDLGKADTDPNTKTTAMLLSANYKMGKELAVGAVYSATNSTISGANNTSEMALGASYDLEVAKLFATYQTQKLDNSAGSANTAMSISAAVPVTSTGSVVATYATTKMNHATGDMTAVYGTTPGADISAAEAKATGMTLAWVQNLSKTATFYAAYSRMTNGTDVHMFSVNKDALATSTLTNGGSSSMIAAGLSKKF